jgi:hypothetical protein
MSRKSRNQIEQDRLRLPPDPPRPPAHLRGLALQKWKAIVAVRPDAGNGANRQSLERLVHLEAVIERLCNELGADPAADAAIERRLIALGKVADSWRRVLRLRPIDQIERDSGMRAEGGFNGHPLLGGHALNPRRQ